MSETSYVEGKENGTRIVFRRDGAKYREIPCKKGKRHGTVIRYFQDGSAKKESWTQGTGTAMTYYDNG